MISRIRFLEAALCSVPVSAPAYAQSNEITPEQLQSFGLHLPSYAPTVHALWEYSRIAPTTCQQLTIDWDSLPGRSDYERYEDVKDIPLAGNFVITGRKRGIKGTGSVKGELLRHGLVVVGITSASQVRSLWSGLDPRITPGENLGNVGPCNDDTVRPHVTFFLGLPEDPQIQTLVFLKPEYDGQKWNLRQIGTLALPNR